MKIKWGFISNSSTTSFIVAFDNIPNPKEIEKLRKLLFGNVWYTGRGYSTLGITGQIILDLQNKKTITKEEMIKIFHSGTNKNLPQLNDYKKK